MASNSSYETSWADQWDPEPITVPEKRTPGGGSSKAQFSQKMEDGFDKTKAAASRGFVKVKNGTAVGVRWIKEKYHKTTGKH
ncbi:hypothetical protein L484_027841 [Morus notabilis]|uniref:Uncharacterized protein n=1 Tax=Morus notabilis TaxID=981085 RepID=W9RL35_9ROSA|nr:hypothetical protein L484_027841 [Morus notabilis]